jgi:hypothetical protein
MSGEPDAQNNHVCVACSGFSDVSEVDQNGGLARSVVVMVVTVRHNIGARI